MAKGRNYRNRVRKQNGGELDRPQGLIQQGSGRIDPSSPEGLPVDDVPAILGKGEYVLNANAVDKVGTQFLDELNNVGLNSGKRIHPGTLPSPSRYQQGGKVNRRNEMRRVNTRKKLRRGGPVRKNPIRRQHGGTTHSGNENCPPGTHWMPPANGQPGYCMEGDTHPVNENTDMTGYKRGGRVRKPIRRQMGGNTNQCPPGQISQGGNCVPAGNGYKRGGKVRQPIKRQAGGSTYVYAGSNTPYNGRVINVGGQPYTTKGGGVEGSRKRLELRRGGPVRKPQRSANVVRRQRGGGVKRVRRQNGGIVNRVRHGIRRKR